MGGVLTSFFKVGCNNEPKAPSYLLGWLQFKPADGHPEFLKALKEKNFSYINNVLNPRGTAHILWPTQLGIDIINKYRENMGLISFEEQRQKARQYIDKQFAYHK